MFEECGRKALTDQKEKQMSDIRSKDMDQHNRVCAQIDLDAIAYNMEQMKDQIGKEARLIAVIKTDGYGHGAVPIARMFETFSYVWGYAVACIEEAVSLRKEGIKKPILVLGCVFPDQYETMIKNEIRAAVYTKEMAEGMSDEAVRQGKNAYFHIKIDTGMGRIGFPVNSESVNLIEEISKLPNIHMEGLFTHFAKADEKEKGETNSGGGFGNGAGLRGSGKDRAFHKESGHSLCRYGAVRQRQGDDAQCAERGGNGEFHRGPAGLWDGRDGHRGNHGFRRRSLVRDPFFKRLRYPDGLCVFRVHQIPGVLYDGCLL